MAFIERDILGPARAICNAYFAIYRTFQRVAPVITVDGNQVYSNKIYIYNNGALVEDNKTKRFANKLGLEWAEFENQDYEGIDRLYLTFDSKKYNFIAETKTDLQQDLDLKFDIDQEFSLKISYGGQSLRYFEDHEAIINDINVLINKLDSDPKTYYANIDKALDTINYSSVGGSKSKTSDIPAITVKAENGSWESFALLDDGTHFERTNIRAVKYKTTDTGRTGRLIDEISFVIDFKVISEITNENSQLITYLKDISDRLQTAMEYTPAYPSFNRVRQMAYERTPNSLIKEALIDLQPYDNTIFYQDYLRVQEVSDMKKKDFVEMLSKTIKVGVDETEAPWWKKALLVIVVIIAATIAIATGGGATGLLLASLKLAAFSATLSIGMMVVNEIGPAGTLGAWGRLVGKVAQMTGIAASVLGAFAAIGALMNQLSQGIAQITRDKLISGLQGIKGLYSTFENMENKDENLIEEEYEEPVLKGSQILAYQDMLSDPDALQRISIMKEQMLGGNMTEALKQKQTK